jgi:hypothetical protein
MNISTSALLLTGSNNSTVHTNERAACSLCSGGSEKEKAAQTWRSVAAFSNASNTKKYISKDTNMQRIILTHVGGVCHEQS